MNIITKLLYGLKILLKDNHGKCDIPDHILTEIARCLLPDIISFYESVEGKEAFENRKNQKEKSKIS